MFSALQSGFARELQAILTLYLGTVLIGFSIGFSAVAIPDIKEEMRQILNTPHTVTNQTSQRKWDVFLHPEDPGN